MDNIQDQKSVVKIFRKLLDLQLTYVLLIFILPLIGLISSNIYTSLSAETWYSNIRFTLPDISHGSYGLYISTFFYLIAGGALVLIYTNSRSNTNPNSKDRLFPYIYYMIPVIFLLIYISNPIMYQSQSLLAPGILYIFATIMALFILYLTFFMNNIAKWLWLVFVIWLLYITIFYFSSYSGDNSSFLFVNRQQAPCNDNPMIIRRDMHENNVQQVQTQQVFEEQVVEVDRTIITENPNN
ncbi:unknown similar to AMEV164 [Mythimna separata entomopoxvirus 'L']|uniref:Uncharacterized protein n=1 Tax=Mythimna separata entomopoxvirus 'L' TaxID=1293572 RepID=A0A916KQA8_9POXV|nr:unknown similar to AMEV164 [Mythimna separata entomopoxvirus 'L']CCU56398.1 unknown similar to AMEV164 [Mythimna separata entomopoxvirus 'L']